MRIKGIRVACFSLFAFLVSYSVSYSEQVITKTKNADGSADYLQVQRGNAKVKVNNFDSLVRKVYLLAEDFFSTDVDYESTIEASQNGRRVYLKAGEEGKDKAPEDEKKSSDNKATLVDSRPADKSKNTDNKEPEVLPPTLEEPTDIKPIELLPPPDVDSDAKDNNKQGGSGIAGVLQRRQEEEASIQKKNQPSGVSPLYWENLRKEYFKKKNEEELKRKEEADNQNESSGEERAFLNPERKPKVSYDTQRLPSSISKKTYSKDNQHLPSVVYEEEYVNILFQSVLQSNLEVMRAMIEKFGTTEVRDMEGNTPLLYAVMAGNIKSATVLLGMGAGVDAKNYAGTSSLYAAAYLSRMDLVEGLLQRRADPDITDKIGKTPLMLAAERNNVGIAEALLDSGASVDKKMRDGNTALHFAARNDAVAIAYALLNTGANPDIRNFEGYTPIMLSAFFGSEQVAGLLANAGADLSNKDSMGQNASNLATAKGFANIAQTIESESIRRNILSSKLKKIKATEVSAQEVQKTEDVKVESKGTVSKKEKQTEKAKPKKIPKPFFSDEEKSKMGGQ